MITLEPMTAAELRSFLDWSIADYAEDHVRAGTWDAAHALERSRAEHAQLLPQGVETPDNYLRTIRAEDVGNRVGEVWYALRRDEGPPQLFVYWIGIDRQFRRRGYASAALRRLETEARNLGATRIALHAFGDNQEGRALYEKLGYQITHVLMAKTVGP